MIKSKLTVKLINFNDLSDGEYDQENESEPEDNEDPNDESWEPENVIN